MNKHQEFIDGEEVRGFRKRMGWSKTALAREINYSRRQIIRWEKGESSPPPSLRFHLNALGK